MCRWEGGERKREEEEESDRERVPDGGEWCLVETDINPDQQGLTAGGQGRNRKVLESV